MTKNQKQDGSKNDNKIILTQLLNSDVPLWISDDNMLSERQREFLLDICKFLDNGK